MGISGTILFPGLRAAKDRTHQRLRIRNTRFHYEQLHAAEYPEGWGRKVTFIHRLERAGANSTQGSRPSAMGCAYQVRIPSGRAVWEDFLSSSPQTLPGDSPRALRVRPDGWGRGSPS